MRSELLNFSLFLFAIAKASLFTGILPGVFLAAIVEAKYHKFSIFSSTPRKRGRVQRHISQAGLIGWDHMIPTFRNAAYDEAFYTVDRLLVELEREFEEKKKRCDQRKRRTLDRRADRQVTPR
jgi:hypothetical protein